MPVPRRKNPSLPGLEPVAPPEAPRVTPMMQQFHEVKAAHPGKLLFFRMGDFYELFYDDSVEASRILQITLTKRHGIPMCGVPIHAAAQYLARLVDAGRKVVVVEQVGEPGKNGLFRREVVQVVTPGTLTDTRLLDGDRPHPLAALHLSGPLQVMGFLELSTGEIDLFPLGNGEGATRRLEALLMRFQPREVLHSEDQDPGSMETVKTPLPPWLWHEDYALRELGNHFAPGILKSTGITTQPGLAGTVWALIHYARETQKADLNHLRPPRIHPPGGTLWVDAVTQRNLELTKSSFDGTENHTLFSRLKATVTAMGTRRLRQSILEPWGELEPILERQGRIAWFLENPAIRDAFREQLTRVGDFERLCARIATGRALPRELRGFGEALSSTVTALENLSKATGSPWKGQKWKDAGILGKAILDRLLDEPANELTHGGVMRPSIHPDLTRFAEAKTQGQDWIVALLESEKKKHGLTSLKVRYNEVHGWFFELPKAQAKQAPAHFIRRQTMVTGERFTTEKLIQLETTLEEASRENDSLEKNLYQNLLEELKAGLPFIQSLADQVALVDLEASLAHLAARGGWCRPEMLPDGDLSITGGRHPVVEASLSDPFIPNDLHLGGEGGHLHLITGPNMSGKSTFLRQNALLVHMAHMGSYVPAESARIPLADRIFTRLGAADQLSRGQSTFMVEMSETSQILAQATARSLVILDEIGRGTSTYDGLSLAWAITEHLAAVGGPRTLFATHYHELTVLEKTLAGLRNFHLKVGEQGADLVFLKKIEPGPAHDSHGIAVAELAGLPAPLLARARTILSQLERGELTQIPTTREAPSPQRPVVPVHPVLKDLTAMDLSRLTPLEALQALDRFQKALAGGKP